MKRFQRQWQQRRTTNKYRSENISWTFGSCDICLGFYGSLSSNSRIFHSYVDLNIAAEGLQILTFVRHSWPLNIEDSVTRGIRLWWSSPRIRATQTYCRDFTWSATAGIRTFNFPYARRNLTFIKPPYLICTYIWFFRSPGWTRHITHQLESYFIV